MHTYCTSIRVERKKLTNTDIENHKTLYIFQKLNIESKRLPNTDIENHKKLYIFHESKKLPKTDIENHKTLYIFLTPDQHNSTKFNPPAQLTRVRNTIRSKNKLTPTPTHNKSETNGKTVG